MILILSQFLRTLKERGEFDSLLPELLLSMGIIPTSKPQTGTRQYGVDLAAIGKDPDDPEKRKKLFLFTLKQGDIGRNTWDTGPQSVYQSLNEILSTYIPNFIPDEHKKLPIKIILGTTGDLKEELALNWASLTKSHQGKAEITFWGADTISELIEKHLLNENIFADHDRSDLRKALALIQEPDYTFSDYDSLLLRQLGLREDGSLKKDTWIKKPKDLAKALTRAHLTCLIISNWASNEGNTKQALIATERALLWSWHRILLLPKQHRKWTFPSFAALISLHEHASARYFNKIQRHCHVKDGFSGYTSECAIHTLSIYEHIGLISTVGLTQALSIHADDAQQKRSFEAANVVAETLISMIKNNPASGSPRLDEHSIDICLALLLLQVTGNSDDAKKWLRDLIVRIDFAYKKKQFFPVSTDSIDDLIELEAIKNDDVRISRFMSTSWMLPTLAGWSVIFDMPDAYNALAENTNTQYPEICKQLWHPTKDIYEKFYFRNSIFDSGEAEAPIKFPANISDYKKQMQHILSSTRHDILGISPSRNVGRFYIDTISCRHFRTPLAPFVWYQFAKY